MAKRGQSGKKKRGLHYRGERLSHTLAKPGKPAGEKNPVREGGAKGGHPLKKGNSTPLFRSGFQGKKKHGPEPRGKEAPSYSEKKKNLNHPILMLGQNFAAEERGAAGRENVKWMPFAEKKAKKKNPTPTASPTRKNRKEKGGSPEKKERGNGQDPCRERKKPNSSTELRKTIREGPSTKEKSQGNPLRQKGG